MKFGFLLCCGLLATALCPAQPIDGKATRETRHLFRNLAALSRSHTLFGHQHATEYGHGWRGDAGRSDIKSVTGAHPAVIGIDIMGLSGGSAEATARTAEALRRNAQATYDRGGLTTIAWHFPNPVSRGGFYWVDSLSLPAVRYLIPGGAAHEQYKSILQTVGAWVRSVRGSDGKAVPMIFRPFHEFDGGWFWWGAPHAMRGEFISLWRFTVSYLRDSLGVHQLLYAFSPDNRFTTEAQFLERYPGDEWVDLLGMDNYGDMGRDGYRREAATAKLKIVSGLARRKGKLAAFTETGLESIPDTGWWTGTLLKVMRDADLRLSYVLVWRNDPHSPTHYYAPFPGQVSVPDFLRFYQHPYTLFEGDIAGMYRRRARIKKVDRSNR